MLKTHAHASKKLRISAGDAATIMNASKWMTPYELWQIKVGMVPKQDISDKKSVQFGKKLELFVILEILAEIERDFNPGNREVWVENDAKDRVGYVDYVVDEETIIEAKTTSSYGAVDWEKGVPEYYLWQVVHYFSLMPKVKQAYVGCLIGGQDIVIHKVERDEAMIQALVVAEAEFYEFCANKKEPPLAVQKVEGQAYDMEPDVADLCARYLDLTKQESSIKKDKEIIKKSLQLMVGNGNTQTGASLEVSFNYEERKSLNEKLLIAAYPDVDLKKVKATSAYYKIQVKEKKS